MPLRPCLDCGSLVDGNRCTSCTSSRNRARDQVRGSAAARGYDHEHKTERQTWVDRMNAGEVVICRRAPSGLCVAATPTIHATDDWHLGHPDAACLAPRAPEHLLCNSGAPRRKNSDPPPL